MFCFQMWWVMSRLELDLKMTTCLLLNERTHWRQQSSQKKRQRSVLSVWQTFLLPLPVILHRRSIAEWAGCFQQNLFLFVCFFVNTITSQRLNVGWWKLVGRCIVQKSWPSRLFGGSHPQNVANQLFLKNVNKPTVWHILSKQLCCAKTVDYASGK